MPTATKAMRPMAGDSAWTSMLPRKASAVQHTGETEDPATQAQQLYDVSTAGLHFADTHQAPFMAH